MLRSRLLAPHAVASSVVCGLVVAVALTGCVGGTDLSTSPPSTSASPSSPLDPAASGPPSASPTPEAPVLVEDGTADDNLAYFDLVNGRLFADGATPDGRTVIDNLVAAGFDKAAMQVTPDATTIGRAVDSVQFSVRIDDRCLIGQARGAQYVGIVGPAASATTCLVGTTRAIDW